MKQALALTLCAVVVGTMVVPVEAKSRRTSGLAARPVVAVPKLPLHRQGGLPIRPVDRGVDRGGLRGYRPDQAVAPSAPLVLARTWQGRAVPAREQVLDLRRQVAQRYKGRGLGARLAREIP